MVILALDIATQTGVAVGSPGSAPKAWSYDLGKGKSDTFRFSRIIRLVQVCVGKYGITHIAIEAPVGGPKTSHLLVGLWACASGSAVALGVPVEKYDISAIRKHFLGRNPTSRDFPTLSKLAATKAIKRQVMDRCALLGWDTPDDDAADAAALWDYACAQRSRSHQMTTVGGLFNGKK